MSSPKFLLKAFLATFLYLNILSSSIGQSISGRVLNTEGKAIDFSSVLLLSDSMTAAAKTFTDEQGYYSFEDVQAGNYMIKVSSISGESVYVPSFIYSGSSIKIKDLQLDQSIKLSELDVSADRQTIELKADRKVFNVSQSLMAEAGTAEDMLKQVPSVQVDNDGEVSLRGNSNVLILIDGKQTAMFGTTNAEIIQQLPAGSIDVIEVMTNPSSKYDAQGMGGIINIVLKKTNQKSKQGSLTLGAGNGDRYNGSFNYTVSNGKTKLGFNLNSRNVNRDDFFKTTRTVYDPYTSLYSEGDHEKRRSRTFGNVTLEQQMRQKDVLSIGLQGSYNYIRNLEKNYAYYRNLAGGDDSSMYREMPFDVNPHSVGTEISYTWHPADGHKIVFSDSYNQFRAERNQSFSTTKYGADNEIIGIDTVQTLKGDGRNVRNIAQADYVYNISEFYTLESGAKYQMGNFSSANQATKTFGSYTGVDSLLTNDFDYDEDYWAVYASLRAALSDKWSAQAGLRYEDFRYRGQSISVEDDIEVSFQNFFPTAFLSYKASDKSAWQLNYSKRVNRPRFYWLFPYINLSDPLNLRVGNPELRPEFMHIGELSYEFKSPGHQLIGTGYLQYTTDLIQRVYNFNPDGTALLIRENLNSSMTYGLDLTHVWTWDKVDWTFNANFFNTEIDGGNISTEISNSGSSWFLKSLVNYGITKKLKLQWTANYLAKAAIAQGIRDPQWYTDLGLRYSALDNKLVFTLNFNDLFNSYRTVQIMDGQELYQHIDRKPNSRYVQLSVTWNFINTLNSNKGKSGQKKSGVKDRNSNFDPGGDSGGEG